MKVNYRIFFHFSIKNRSQNFLPPKKATSGQPLTPSKYMRFGPKRASYIRNIGASVSSGISGLQDRNPLHLLLMPPQNEQRAIHLTVTGML